jgi:chaperone required for assembly of F1-ATPase
MREIFTELFEKESIDAIEAARRAERPRLHKRFYGRAHIHDQGESGIGILLDGKPVRTPARRHLAAPTRPLAAVIVDEWNSQKEFVDPARMPLTRLANAAIDPVSDKPEPIAEEVAKYLGTDLLFYRADAPFGLVEKQGQAWDPVLVWARDVFGARFLLTQGVIHVRQPQEAIDAMRAVIPSHPWRLAAVSSITSLTGSALLALAVAHGALDGDKAWKAAHVDEDWQMSQWGQDKIALERRAYREAEFQAAVTVLREVA